MTQGPKRSAARIGVSRHESGTWDRRQDSVAVEEPMEIRLDVPSTGGGAKGGRTKGGRAEVPVSVTMRTPGDDFLLVAGFLFGEGLVSDRHAIVDLRYCRNVTPQEFNVVTVTLRDPIDPASLTRNFYMTSSCGVCGKGSIEAVEVQGCTRLPRGELSLSAASILGMPEQVRAAQAVFEETGGLHAAGLFDAAGTLLDVREDIGRHNAVDKVVGAALLDGRVPLHDHVLAVSGRASFELVQKAVVAGIPALVAVGAPSSLAVDLAERFGMTLVGFVRGGAFNVYAGPER
ncbi:MAG TPA: formate dehydrogenase accessory sulfurtransferase FdhD, partial [Longimicrobiales bacterium]|nr:formate dehydrogenase accessory sulfurtransferase FdhD [Longimicrobiales bacterium]